MHDRFRTDVLTNRNNRIIFDRWSAVALPDSWLVAGCLFQTVWNLRAGLPVEQNIKDYDLFYFDNDDLSQEAEQNAQFRVDDLFADLNIPIEVSNQARVHIWYESYFGFPYEALNSSSEGIDRFLIPATCVGMRPDAIYAPHGLDLIYEGVLTENSLTPYAKLFEQKAASYCARWPFLRVLRSLHAAV